MSTVRKITQQSILAMGTTIHLKVISTQNKSDVEFALQQAFAAFRFIECLCSRFDEQSELRQLTSQIGFPVQVSPTLFAAIHFAREVAELTGGVFDPTIGGTLEYYGFNRHYLTGRKVTEPHPLRPANLDFTDLAMEAEADSSKVISYKNISYKDIVLDEARGTVMLLKPLVLDLGAIAKGMAVDLAKSELTRFEGFMIDAGGDLFVGGLNESELPWRVGIQHPLNKDELIHFLQLSYAAVCTSGGYERISPFQININHLVDPLTGKSPAELLSCTVIAPFAMMADAFSTAAILLGLEQGKQLLEDLELPGLFITADLEIHYTKAMRGYLHGDKSGSLDQSQHRPT